MPVLTAEHPSRASGASAPHVVGVDAIAEAAETNKMTLYRHFGSKDELIAECMRQLAREWEANWDRIAEANAGNPKGQLLAWLKHVGEFKLNISDRGCAFVNAAVQIADVNHPARRVIEAHKMATREKLVRLCREAKLVEPELLADKVFLLLEGARVSIQSCGPRGPAARLVSMLQGLVADHARRGR
jgi:AcrR family transcriptional regulator